MKLRALVAFPAAAAAAFLVLSACAAPGDVAGTATLRPAATIAPSVPSSVATPTASGATAGTVSESTATPAVGVAAVGELGAVLVDARGLTLYAFANDTDGVSTCFDACATAWPAVTGGEPPAVSDLLDPTLFGTADRPDGTTQLKVGEWPLYTYAGDGAPGEANGQGVGDVWFAVTPDGTLLRPGVPTAAMPERPAAPSLAASSTAGTGAATSAASEAGTTPAGPPQAAGPAVALAPVDGLGEVMVGANGHTLYAFTEDPAGQTTCFDACAAAWPPLLVDSDFVVSDELQASGASLITRPDGTTQLAMGPWALYYYSGDGAPGEANGQGAGGTWYAVDAACKLVRTA